MDEGVNNTQIQIHVHAYLGVVSYHRGFAETRSADHATIYKIFDYCGVYLQRSHHYNKHWRSHDDQLW
jgi:hypothetical protein